MSRLTSVLALVVVATAFAFATPAAAKEGVVARVLTPIPRGAKPASKVSVVWTLYRVEDGKRIPFGAGGVFIRLFGADGARTPRAYASELEQGRYRARARVPRGGVQKVVIGLMGTACDSAGCRPSPALFRIVGKLFR